MNKLYLIIVLVGMLASSLSAHNKLIVENRIWEYFTYKGYDCKLEQFCFDGIEERYGREYTKWKMIKKTEWLTCPETEPMETELDSVVALLREDNGKVYMLLDGQEVREYDAKQNLLTKPYVATNGDEALLYDFTVAEGDSFEEVLKILWEEESPLSQDVITNCKVVNTDFFPLNIGEAKKFTIESNVHVALLQNLSPSNLDIIDLEIIFTDDTNDDKVSKEQSTVCYAEMVGNIGRGNMTAIMPENAIFLTSGMMDYEICHLTRVFDEDGTIIYGTPSKVISLDTPQLASKGKIYDLHGREVSSPVSGSIYIRDGNKFVAQ